MGVHPEFPKSPYAEPGTEPRWFPAAEELRASRAISGPVCRPMSPLGLRQLLQELQQFKADKKSLKVAVKVIDIFGNDTMTLVPVSVG